MKAMLAALLLSPWAAFGTAEYHWLVCKSSAHDVRQKLGATATDGKERIVYYLDTAGRDSYQRGIVFRVRGEKGEDFETTVKAVVEPSSLPSGWLGSPGFSCETDFVGASAKAHCWVEDRVSRHDLNRYLSEKSSARDLFSKRQLRFLGALGFAVPWDDLRPYGPIEQKKWGLTAVGLALDLERYRKSSGIEILGLSSKSSGGSQTGYAKLTRDLQSHRVRLCPQQTSKTAWALGIQGR